MARVVLLNGWGKSAEKVHYLWVAGIAGYLREGMIFLPISI